MTQLAAYMETAQECPECHRRGVFLKSRLVEIDGEPYGAVSPECRVCGWKPSDDEVVEQTKAWLNEIEELNR